VGITPETGMSFARSNAFDFGAPSLVLNHPLWTIAVESLYYLVSPFLLRRGPWVAAGLVVIGGLIHVAIALGRERPVCSTLLTGSFAR